MMSFEYILRIGLLLSLGGLGALLAVKLKLPTGVFLGPIVLVAAYQIAFGTIMEKPSWFRLIVQIVIGIVLGTSVTKAFFHSFKKIIKPTIMVCSALISGGFLMAVLIHRLTGWDIHTCILATAPGGQAEIIMLADSIGAETEKVIALQLVRNQLVVIGLLPLAKYFMKYREKEIP
ncbi:MAG: AbrB family transcriptional regulator [Clostridia bacterium]|jgi:membrane AbrB-like protein|nr:AbrB family transcriptional regulator [Clostridia bacterium]